MADYKKKNIKKLQPTKEIKHKNIEMHPKKSYLVKKNDAVAKRLNLKVVKGRKDKRLTAVSFLAAVAIILLIAYSVFILFHPIGVVEYINSAYKKIGSGKGYPISFIGEEIVAVDNDTSAFYVLNQTELHCYNTNGKIASKVQHGLANPILRTSDTRALVYGQGEKLLKVYNFENTLANIQLETAILAADISDNGNFAVATYADSYDSVVKVFNKKNELIFEWYSATGIVNNVTLTENGNKILVSTFTADNGIISSKIHVLNFKSADAEHVFSFNDDIFYDVVNISHNKFYVIFENRLELIDIKKGTTTQQTIEYSNKIVDSNRNKVAVLSSLSANLDKNIITVLGTKGETISSFSADYIVSDFVLSGSSVFILSNSEILRTDFSGNILSRSEVSFDIKKIIPITDRYVAAISNNGISKIELKKGVEQ